MITKDLGLVARTDAVNEEMLAGNLQTQRGGMMDGGKYRYTLTRQFENGSAPKRVLFCALNPSTATATQDDPTVRRMIHFAKRLGASEMRLVNLYALRSTEPSKLWRVRDPVGPDNDLYISRQALLADVIIAAWGAATLAQRRADAVLAILRRHGDVYRLGPTSLLGHPRHPLYLRADTPLEIHAVSWAATTAKNKEEEHV